MRFNHWKDASGFLDRCGPFLFAEEARNNLIIGVARNAAAHLGGDAEPFFAVAENSGAVVGAAAMTPPFALVLTECPEEALSGLVTLLDGQQASVRDVVGPVGTVSAFVRKFCLAHTDTAYRTEKRMRIYRLDSVRQRERSPGGRMRPAEPGDLDLLIEYGKDFYRMAHEEHFDAEAVITSAMREGRLFLWEVSEPVSMAAWVRDTPHGKAIALVYTPENRRRQGYASALVAAVSRRALDEGKRYCCLYADLDNPTTNHIYQEIGYRPVEDALHIVLEPLPL